jgi:hypothetical protein
MECSRNYLHAPAPALLDSPPQNLLMPEVHAVKVPQRNYYPAQSTTSALP